MAPSVSTTIVCTPTSVEVPSPLLIPEVFFLAALQLTYPGTKISTMQEVFDFVSCSDPDHQILWNIESKINAAHPNQTRSVEDFVTKQHAVFAASPYYNAITVRTTLPHSCSLT